MHHKAIIYLLTSTVTPDSLGNQIVVTSEIQVFANEFSIGSREFYNAAVAGLKPIKTFEIYTFEYDSQEQLKHDEIIYRIIRSENRGEKTRLICESAGADVNEPFGAYLSILAIGVLTLVPFFSAAKDSYTTSTKNNTDVIVAVAINSAATITIELNGILHVNGALVTWEEGANTVEVTVTNGVDSKVYTVTVTKS